MTHTKKPWTPSDEKRLIDLWGQEVSIEEIAKRLGRREPVVRAKVSRLRRRSKELAVMLKLRTVYENYVLNEQKVRLIRKDKRSLRLIGLTHGVSPVTIFKIKNREIWRHVK